MFSIIIIFTITILLFCSSSRPFSSSLISAEPGSTLKPNDPLRTTQFGPVATVPFEPMEDCNSLVVMIHGMGDSGDSKEGWMGTLAGYQMKTPGVCVILPTSRKMYVKVAKQQATAWYDVSEARFRDLKQEVDVDEVKASAEYILTLTKKYMKRFDIPWKRVIFAGFSQGASMALYVGLTAPETPAAIISLSGFLAAQSKLLGLGVMGRLRSDVPILMIHGNEDKVVDIAHALHALESLKKAGVKNVMMETDAEMGHGLNDDMWEVMRKFMTKKLQENEDDDTEDM